VQQHKIVTRDDRSFAGYHAEKLAMRVIGDVEYVR